MNTEGVTALSLQLKKMSLTTVEATKLLTTQLSTSELDSIIELCTLLKLSSQKDHVQTTECATKKISDGTPRNKKISDGPTRNSKMNTNNYRQSPQLTNKPANGKFNPTLIKERVRCGSCPLCENESHSMTDLNVTLDELIVRYDLAHPNKSAGDFLLQILTEDDDDVYTEDPNCTKEQLDEELEEYMAQKYVLQKS